MFFTNDYLFQKLAKHREAELLEKARINQLLVEARAGNPSARERLLARGGDFLIAVGQKLKARYEPQGVPRVAFQPPASETVLTDCC